MLIRHLEFTDAPAVRVCEKLAAGQVAITRNLEDWLEVAANYGYVATVNHQVVGYCLYTVDFFHGTISLMQIVVLPAYQRRKIGHQLLNKVKTNCSHRNRIKIVAIVTDAEIETHLFLRACGFKAEKVLKPRDSTSMDKYAFVWRPAKMAVEENQNDPQPPKTAGIDTQAFMRQ